MAQRHHSMWRYIAYGALAFLFVLLVWNVVALTGSGRAPVATAGETASGSVHINLAAWPWTLFILIGTVALGAAIAYGEIQGRKVTRQQWDAGEAKTRELYKDDQG